MAIRHAVVGTTRITFVWAWRSWTFGVGFPSNVYATLFCGPLIVWVEPDGRTCEHDDASIEGL